MHLQPKITEITFLNLFLRKCLRISTIALSDSFCLSLIKSKTSSKRHKLSASYNSNSASIFSNFCDFYIIIAPSYFFENCGFFTELIFLIVSLKKSSKALKSIGANLLIPTSEGLLVFIILLALQTPL